ncbi:hypothetical protein HYD_3320 [Candidatus Hydrogenosomobacter endosymbioticus]|uniref:Uncharacterized protein n=2 Tax=Candidatus Hydrogenosomobacter endosymbioticus TaxID=2558174 RepID=A0ABM7V8R8_9PROT|nr:hypothetical protein HYD_3320 [Candidatus Hydrogenosomobacter endosymbioticus]
MKNDEPSFSNSLAGGAEKAQNHSIEYKKPDSQKEIAAKSLLKSSENKQGSKLSNSIKPEANTVNNNTQHALIMSDSMVAATKNDENKNNKDEKKEESAHISTKQPESKLVNRPSVSSSGKSSPENEKNPDVEQARKKDLEERIKNKGGEENKKSVKNFGPPMKKPENKRDFKQENDAGKKNHEEKKYAKNHALEAGRAHAILAQSAPEPIAITNIVKSSTLTKTNENRDSNKAQGAENNVAQQRTTKTVSFSKPKTLNYKTSSTQTTTQAEMAKKITSKAERSKLTAIKPTQQKQTSPAESEKVAHERKLNINYRHDGTSERDHRVRSKSVRKTMRHSDKNSKRKKPTIYPN